MSRLLSQMVRDECANYKNGCMVMNLCTPYCPVIQGKPCTNAYNNSVNGCKDYFGACVVGLAAYINKYKKAAIEYTEMCAKEYSHKDIACKDLCKKSDTLSVNRAVLKAVKRLGRAIGDRKCKCGMSLCKGKRLCDSCKNLRKKSRNKDRYLVKA